MDTRVDDYGRVVLDVSSLEDLLYAGGALTDVLVEVSPETEQFDLLCRKWDRPQYQTRHPEPLAHSPEEEHTRRANEWFIAQEMQGVDVRAFLLSLCKTEEEIARINLEMDLYEERDLLPILRLMMYLVDHFRRNKVVWGVGRGSSVASYALFLIGLHKIDSLKFKLDIREFLKESDLAPKPGL